MVFICGVYLLLWLLFEAVRGLTAGLTAGLTGGEGKERINDCLEPLLFEGLILLLLLEFDLLKKFILF